MAAFRLINNTSSVLAMSDSYKLGPYSEDLVGQVTLEMRRYESAEMLTILEVAAETFVYDDKLLPDYIDTGPLNYVEGSGAPVLPPTGSGNDLHYNYTQGVASATWTIAHSLGKFPSVTIVDSAGSEVEGSVHHADANNLTVSFSAPFSGTAYLN